MPQTIPVTYRQPGSAPIAEMRLPLIDKSAITVLADIAYSSGERVLIFSREGSMAHYQARSMETYWPGALFGSSIDTPVDPRNTMILDLGEEGAFVCHSGRGLPFVSVDRWSAEVLRIDWVPIRKINEHIDNDARLTLDLPEAREAVQEAGIKVSVSRRVCDPSLIGVADKAEDELFDLLGRVEAEADALNDFSCNYDSEFPNDTGESGLLDRARTQARTLWLLRKKMNEKVEL